MTDHGLRRNPDNEPVCTCGFRPDILETDAPVGKLWKAKAAVLDHVNALTDETNTSQHPVTRFAEEVLGLELTPWQRTVLDQSMKRSPEAPFQTKREVRYPRAGVRKTADGKWLLTLWDGDTIVHAIDEDDRTNNDWYTAVTQGWMTVGACQQAGTNLNGYPLP
ncbi:hypothetical protein [Arthrobacter sp. MP_2.3]|uniref:hypothetical protein n=1 Tax=Arthrobacter sp. MP_2.3 TaxID=3349633 RepID=UPI0038D3B120